MISDPHVTYPVDSEERLSRDSLRILEDTIEDIEETGAELVFFTGDILEARYHGQKNLDLAFETLSRLSIPWFVLIGNHDTKHRSTLDDYETSDFLERFNGHGPDGTRAYWRYDCPGKKLTFIGLDSTRPLSTRGVIDQHQKDWLEVNLSEIEEDRYVILLTHHPFILFDREIDEIDEMKIYILENHQEIKCLVERHKTVKLVISGHNHTCRTISENGVVYVGCPSINTWPAMYSKFSVDVDRIEYSHLPIKEFEKVDKLRKKVLSDDSPWVRILGSSQAVNDYFNKGPLNGELPIIK